MYNANRPTPSDLPSPGRLLRSTVLAAFSAAAILVAVVLPSEYGIDPTGAGRMLGLTDMGYTKMQLAAEAEADRKAEEANAAAAIPAPAPTMVPDLSGLDRRIEMLESAVRDLTRTLEASRTASLTPAPEASAVPASVPASTPVSVPEPNRHEASFTLSPGQGIEVKLVMKKGAQAEFAWSSEGGPVNFDTHGDGAGDLKISYEKGRGVESDEGTITAEFDGNHGWFWRNRNQDQVTLTLRTAGDYTAIKGLPN